MTSAHLHTPSYLPPANSALGLVRSGVLSLALALLLLATWGSGGEAKWATGLIIIAGGLGLLALVLTSGNIPKGLIIAGLLWITAATWSVIQSLEIGPLAHPLWAEATRALPSMQGGSIALDPHAARMSGVMTLSLAGVACLGIVVARQDRAMAVLLGLSGIIALFSLAALLQMSDQAAGPRDIVRHAADASFPFTSRNTFCAFAGVGVIASASLLAASRAHQRVLQAFCLGCLLCCTAGVLSSHSRAGLAVVAAGSAISLILVSRRPAMLFLVGLAGLALVAVSMSGITGERTASLGEDYGVRLAIWRASAEIAWQHLWLGVGSLDQALQMHAGEWGERHILRAHNIYLQAAAERGLPASLAILAALGFVLRQCSKSLADPAPIAAVTLGVTAMFALHGLVDFSIQVPTNATILALLLGLAVGQRQEPSQQDQPRLQT